MPQFPAGTVTFLFTDIEQSTQGLGARRRRGAHRRRASPCTHPSGRRDPRRGPLQDRRRRHAIGLCHRAARGRRGAGRAARAARRAVAECGAAAAGPHGASRRDGRAARRRLSRRLPQPPGASPRRGSRRADSAQQHRRRTGQGRTARGRHPEGAGRVSAARHPAAGGGLSALPSRAASGLPAAQHARVICRTTCRRIPRRSWGGSGRWRRPSPSCCGPDVRLVTLTGPGGVGKTRLGAAGRGGGARVVPGWRVHGRSGAADRSGSGSLGDRDGARVARAARADPARRRLTDYLRERRILLLFDNFEHVLPAATLVAELLAAGSGAEGAGDQPGAARLQAEHEYRVEPLPVPDPARCRRWRSWRATTRSRCSSRGRRRCGPASR